MTAVDAGHATDDTSLSTRMRWSPILADVAIMVAVSAAVLWLLGRRRARLADGDRASQGYRLHAAAALCAAVGITWFTVWLITDTTGPHWLHTLSLSATLVFLAIGAIAAGCAGWVGGL